MSNSLHRVLFLALLASLFTLSAQAQYSVTTASGNLSIHDDNYNDDYYYGKTRLMLRGYYDAYNVDRGAGNVFLRNSVFNHYDHSSYQSGSGAIPGHQTSMYGLSMFTQGTERLRIDYDGHVGIGMPSETTNPKAPLHVWATTNGNIDENGIYLDQASSSSDGIIATRVYGDGSGDPKIAMDVYGESGWVMGLDNNDNNKFKIAAHGRYLTSNPRLTIDHSTGYVGIGTTGPQHQLQVEGQIYVGQKDNSTHAGIYYDGHNSGDTWDWFTGTGTGNYFRIKTNGNEHFIIKPHGNVGVGVAEPSEKLEVAGNIVSTGLTANGNISATDITASGNVTATGDVNASRVTVQAGTFPDYVFAPEYTLMPLAEVEAYIQAYRHLPNFPSANEVIAEGQDLGQLNILLTEKVEELTLHAIAQEKRIAELEALVKAMIND